MVERREPGWYPDPDGALSTERYWDGTAWTNQVRPESQRQPPGPAQPTGWYPDPGGSPKVERFWDGAAWTDHYRPQKRGSSRWIAGRCSRLDRHRGGDHRGAAHHREQQQPQPRGDDHTLADHAPRSNSDAGDTSPGDSPGADHHGSRQHDHASDQLRGHHRAARPVIDLTVEAGDVTTTCARGRGRLRKCGPGRRVPP